ncbi:MAG: glycosyl transferase [Anaerolineaceae bacterium]|jgi:lipopolysaccharide/colanic/teichoic acid biosynthesis glycosyltransferase|nr:sugar transferase [Anaerolineae bacterium]MBV6465770.1 UDP-N-acetylgalactosamine-undecaprenyl-phosphate N-acetylgalactosaminephosphotransferase [Anaerolineales bacterium]MCE7905801.1 sugar transferase [Anaerolineae bacterium CFX3]MDL1924768.1 sugar transferase [Anaerolineae bacterium AMX1]OQY85281.1 MAG: sugar transferase [Anaerolineae bacterium UTCFX3]GER79498.1 sugar transferase [Candidatus Denitrolinea symbiosum]GIK08504.1 MAG: glycosyl transferase [Chloroflexota bacterium]GJQ38346.1 M
MKLDYAWIRKFDPKRRVLTGRAYYVSKRFLDLLIVILSMPFWLPLIAVIALLIKITSPGAPAIFVQYRTGRSGRRFPMYKFRSMVPNAEELKAKYAHLNELKWPDFKITNDPRITPLGKFLRKSSLDEIPQLFNVLRGEMSLVGPRPTSFGADTYQLWHTERLDVLPGLTGLWQIVGRASMEFDDRLRLDIAYIERRSLWFDLNILFWTVFAVLQQRGAH